MSPSRNTFARIFVISMLLLPVLGMSKVQQPAVERIMSLSVLVTESHGRVVTGLGKEQFRILEGNTPREISSISGDDQPISVAVLVDMSGSMSSDTSGTRANFISDLKKHSNTASKFLLVGFDEATRVLCNWSCSDQELGAALTAITTTKPRRSTALLDALQWTLDSLDAHTKGQRAVVILSDGADNKSKVTSSRLRDRLKQSDVIVDAVNPVVRSGVTVDDGKALLTMLTSVSGGTAYFPTSEFQVPDIGRRISTELRHRYTIQFKLPGVADHRFHSVKVRVSTEGLPNSPHPPAMTAVSRPEFLDQ